MLPFKNNLREQKSYLSAWSSRCQQRGQNGWCADTAPCCRTPVAEPRLRFGAGGTEYLWEPGRARIGWGQAPLCYRLPTYGVHINSIGFTTGTGSSPTATDDHVIYIFGLYG